MEIDGVFAGGGVKAIAFVGALKVLEDKGYTFQRVAGTSAGAIIASLIKAGYTSKELTSVLSETNLQQFLDPKHSILPFPFIKWLRVYKRLGLYKGDELESWLREKLKAKGVTTFADLPKGSLKIIASDLTKGQLIVLPDDLEKYGIIPDKFSVAKAVRMSCSLPYFFEPVKLYDGKGQQCIIVDGGVISNFPMWLFTNKKGKSKRPVLGFKLSDSLEEAIPNKIDNAFEMVGSLLETMLKARDNRYISKDIAENIVFIPVEKIKLTEFTLAKKKVEELIELGRQRTENYFFNHNTPLRRIK
ncbi:patatin-like phospholipase family protein [Anaerobacillus sp. MEB173]|uniref:patatin-like phospholipase family protein n=1 Tax=Anaerobacillus sp. MEB173 TaxID=3383345 RepID=UPI003F927076